MTILIGLHRHRAANIFRIMQVFAHIPVSATVHKQKFFLFFSFFSFFFQIMHE